MKEQNRENNRSPGYRSDSASSTGTKRPLKRQPIAVIGIGCRFPGANGPEAFWRLLRDGVAALTEVPQDRFDIDAFHDPVPGTPGKLASRSGGFIEKVDRFDAGFFGISLREASRMDPQQRILLEVAWEALEDAGQVRENLAGSPTGVFVGACNSDYEGIQYYLCDRTGLDIYAITGSGRSITSGRLSYAFDFRGPSLTIDTACSSSLVAVHLACRSLWSGECTLALAAGVNLVLLPQQSIAFSRSKMLSPDARCKFGDAGADGFVRSDGAGVVVLKHLRKAEADGDPIYAVIRGSAVNNDGRTGRFLSTPGGPGQEAVLRQAYIHAGIEPNRIHYVEAHGTGTSVGDPVEVQSLGAVLGEGRVKDQPCLIGSVKTNIGHTEGAAGIAGLIKTALCLKNRAIPASLNCQSINPKIPWQDLALTVQREFTPWPADAGPRLAGVSSFGISGTNAHVVLEEAPRTSSRHGEADAAVVKTHLLTLSAHSEKALESMARHYGQFTSTSDLRDYCYTSSVRRTHHEHRLALIIRSHEELKENLDAFIRGEISPSMHVGHADMGSRRKLVFVYPGQGSQWLGMGRDLLKEESAFRNALKRCDRIMRPHLRWSLLRQLTEPRSRLNEIDVIQPVLFAIQVALTELWRSWGIEPEAVVGTSMGELAATYAAGALSLEDAALIICRRSQLLKRVSGRGGMAVVALSLEDARRAIVGCEDHLSVAVSNSPTSTVLSGDLAILREVIARLELNGVFCRTVNVDVASHSPTVAPLCADLLQVLETVKPRHPLIPIYSTVTGGASRDLKFDAEYWVRNLREPVLFSTAVQQMIEDHYDVFLEISPNPTLLSAIQQGVRHSSRQLTVLPSLRRDEEGRAVMLSSLGALYTLGRKIKWSSLYARRGRVVRLPSYPWQSERYWIEDQEANSNSNRSPSLAERGRSGLPRHLLSGTWLKSASHSGTFFWETDLSTDSFPYLNDHRIQEAVVLPAAAFVEMALTAAAKAFGDGPRLLEKIEFKKALVLPENGSRKVQLILSSEGPGKAYFQFFSSQEHDGLQHKPWDLHAVGKIGLEHGALRRPMKTSTPNQIRARCTEMVSGADHYKALSGRGLHYGARFQSVKQLWRLEGNAIGRIRAPQLGSTEAEYKIHPCVLDACFQILTATMPGAAGELYLPVRLEELRFYDRPPIDCWGYAQLRQDTQSRSDSFKGDVFLLDDDGQVAVEAIGLTIQYLDGRAKRDQRESISDWFYEIQWRSKKRPPQDLTSVSHQKDQPGTLLIFSDNIGIGWSLQELLQSSGWTCVMVSRGETYHSAGSGHYQINPANPEDFNHLLRDIMRPGQVPCAGVVHLWSLEAEITEAGRLSDLEASQLLSCVSPLHLVKALAEVNQGPPPRLWLVTRGAQAVGGEAELISLAQSPLWGLGAVILHEHPELQCKMIDIGPGDERSEAELLFRELCSENNDNRVAFRGGERFAARLARCSSEALQAKTQFSSNEFEVPVGNEPFRLEIGTPGNLDNLELRLTEQQEPGPGEVGIEVSTTGLNFRDVMLALGVLPSLPAAAVNLGWECAGRIAAIGEGVNDFKIGDEVFAIATPCFGAFARTRASLTLPKPGYLSFEEAATIPIAFLTAFYALCHLGKLQNGERVLVHSATGGVGLAALQIARLTGAEILATAGSQQKRSYLKSIGISQVMDSRSPAFSDEVMELTRGEGLDVVLNSLAGEAIPNGLSILRTGGRFLELGRRDIYRGAQLSLDPFRNNLSFFAIDLDQLIREKPDRMGSILKEVMRYFDDNRLKPIPFEVFPISQAAKAFRRLTQSKHIGKIIVSTKSREALIARRHERPNLFRSDGTYLITGGLGELGLTVARWMLHQGARNLVLMGRRDPSAAVCEVLKGMRETGARIVIARADVSRRRQVARTLARINQRMPPLRGIIHAAGILDDGILLQQDRQRFESVMSPKVGGAWNLQTLTLDDPLDFFILFSSSASLIGSPGQGNYSAANAFLDALAHYCRAQGRPCLSINWGLWADMGLAAGSQRTGRLLQRGFNSITPEQGLEAMGLLLRQGSPQIAVMPFDLKQWSQFHPAACQSPLFDGLRVEANRSNVRGPYEEAALTRDSLLAATGERRRELLESYLAERIRNVTGLSTSRLPKLDVHQPVIRLGIDSLMLVELKTRVAADLGVVIPIMKILEGWGLAQIATDVLSQLAGEPSLPQGFAPTPGEMRLVPGAALRLNTAPGALANDGEWEELAI